MAYKLTNIKKQQPLEPPCKKTIYNSPEEARDMIRYLSENRGVDNIRVYKCESCGYWHLTSKSR